MSAVHGRSTHGASSSEPERDPRSEDEPESESEPRRPRRLRGLGLLRLRRPRSGETERCRTSRRVPAMRRPGERPDSLASATPGQEEQPREGQLCHRGRLSSVNSGNLVSESVSLQD